MLKLSMSEVDVCEECADRCLVIHKKNRDPTPIVSSFFKVVIDERFFRFLPVPPRFAPRLASLLDQETYVEDSSGRKWTITLSTVNGSLAFERGWHDFSLDHGIELGDFVIVHYILNSHFVVQIYGKSGCEKLILPSEDNIVRKKRIRTTADMTGKESACIRHDNDLSTSFNSGLCLTTFPSNMELKGSLRARLDSCAVEKNKGCLEESCLMVVNRDNPMVGEEDRNSFFDLFASEISNTKPVGKVDDVEKGNGSYDAVMTDKHIAFGDVLKDTSDKSNSGTREGNGNMMNIIQFEGETHQEVDVLLHNSCSDVKDLLDDDDTFEDLLGDPPDAYMSEINEKGRSVVTDLPLSVLNANEHSFKEQHIPPRPRAQITTSVRQIDEGHAPGIGGNHSLNIHSDQEGCCSLAVIPVKESIGQTLKTVKIEHKVFNQERIGPKPEPNVSAVLRENLNAGGVGKMVKAEPADDTQLEVASVVIPNSESILEIPKGLPTVKPDVNVKVVVLRDSKERLWPVLYHEEGGWKALVYGWKSFSRANGIQSGDQCVFILEDKSESIYRVHITPKQVTATRTYR